VYGKERSKSLEEHKHFVAIYISAINRKYHFGGREKKVFSIKYSCTKPVPRLSMKIYEYQHKNFKVTTELINIYTLEFTTCNRCCF
jgi:hypothetical protein